MPLGTHYADQDCSLARTLELVGERWTLLIVRDAFLGVRRFNDFLGHLAISKAVLTHRLSGLVDAGVFDRIARGGRADYVLTERGGALWPAVFALLQWGESQSAGGPRRIFAHDVCGTDLEATGLCPSCGMVPPPAELLTRPGPGMTPGLRNDPVSTALRYPRRLLEPLAL